MFIWHQKSQFSSALHAKPACFSQVILQLRPACSVCAGMVEKQGRMTAGKDFPSMESEFQACCTCHPRKVNEYWWQLAPGCQLLAGQTGRLYWVKAGSKSCIPWPKWEAKLPKSSARAVTLKDGLRFCSSAALTLALNTGRNLTDVTQNIPGERQSSKWILSQSILLDIHFHFSVSSEDSRAGVRNAGR